MFAGDGSCRCGVKGSQRIVGGEEADVSYGQDGVDNYAYFHICTCIFDNDAANDANFHTCVYLCILVVCEETDVWAR